jgi:7,8-dihydroneopterin aldolase/epimerase/oxygenase
MTSLISDPRLQHCRRLFLRDWQIQANIGVHDFEHGSTQPITLNLDVYVDLAQYTPKHDDLSEVFDYDAVRAVVLERLARGHVNLQETLVDDLAHVLLQMKGVCAVRISSEKTRIYSDLAGIGIEIMRFRQDLT